MRLWRFVLTFGVERIGEKPNIAEGAGRVLAEAQQLHAQTEALLAEARERNGDPEAFARLLATVDLDAPLSDEEGVEHGP